jgi:hypothetical protein
VFIKKSKKVSQYLKTMLMREGLSFSDYYDESVPYEVKPVTNTLPGCMEEEDPVKNYGEDYPLRAKDLYKGLWEAESEFKRPEWAKGYWLDKDGELYKAESHFEWAKEWLRNTKHIIPPRDSDDVEQLMFKEGFIRVKIHNLDKRFYICYGGENDDSPDAFRGNPTRKQWTSIKELTMEHPDYDVYNETTGNFVHRSGNLDENYRPKTIFILEEGMMPDNKDEFKLHLASLFNYLRKELQLKTIPKVKLIEDDKNARKVLGKTAYYNPDAKLVALYVTDRHQKDILRSFAHEIIHCWQHENEKLTEEKLEHGKVTKDPQYAQNNPWLRQMEKQAYLLGNIMFRDWEDQKKATDRRSGKKFAAEQHGTGNVATDSMTPIMKQKYNPKHAYRKHTEGPQEPHPNSIKEKMYVMGKDYPPKHPDYSG